LNRDRAHLRADDTVGTMVAHPAFAGFGHLLLPWDDRTQDETLRLANIGRLLPYHTHVGVDVVVSALNHLADESSAGRPVFHEIYTAAEKRSVPTVQNTGLFFFPGTPGAPFALIAPGGGFEYVASVHEGFPYAVEISRRGYNAFVVRYRAGEGGQVATEDMARAVSYAFQHAKDLAIGTDGYSLWGSSAGARMAASIGSHGVARFGGVDVPGPAVVVMAYTGQREVAAHEPPTFVVAGERDPIASPSVMESRVARLRESGTPVEYRCYRGVGHGFGLGVGTSAQGWVAEAIRFWASHVQ
jgi:acetyl esterase/lipase